MEEVEHKGESVEEHHYGTDSRHTLDLYRQQGGQEPEGTVVFVHGGAWVDRSKAQFGTVGRGLVRASGGRLRAAVVNYRLSPRTSPPTLVHPAHALDLAAALRWLSEQYPGQPLWVCGHSAGAHMAGLLALDPSYLAPQHEGRPEVRVAGWIGIAGIYDLVRLQADFPSYKKEFIAFAFGEDETKWPDASPQHLRNTTFSKAPWLVLHSGQDELVNCVQSAQFVAHLRELEIPVAYNEDPQGGTHWDGVNSLAHEDSPLSRLIMRFLFEDATLPQQKVSS